jgi:N-acetylneuraminic acid mutarotase
MMADLPGEPGVLLLGGAHEPGPPDLPDMWSYEPKSGWFDITPSTLPESDIASGVVGNAFEFDVDSGLAVFVDIEGNTYAYDPTADRWTAEETNGGPTELLGSSMVYDAGSDRMIVFGGFSFDSGPNAETWAYDVDSNTWEHMQPKSHPSARNYSAMAYDAGSDRVILFGGDDGTDVFGDTWAYDYESDTWTKMSPAKSPAARDYSWMVYDPRGDRVILFGGSRDMDTAAFDDTWAYDYDKDGWTRLAIEGPSARAWHAMSYDDRTKTVVLFGGGSSREEYTAETWTFNPRANIWSLGS